MRNYTLLELRSSVFVQFCSEVFLPRLGARHLYHRNRNVVNAESHTSAEFFQTFKVRGAFNYLCGCQNSTWLTDPAFARGSHAISPSIERSLLPILQSCPGLFLAHFISTGRTKTTHSPDRSLPPSVPPQILRFFLSAVSPLSEESTFPHDYIEPSFCSSVHIADRYGEHDCYVLPCQREKPSYYSAGLTSL